MAPHSSTLAWKIPWTEEPGRLQSMGSRRVRYNWATSLSLFLSCIGEGNGNPLQCSCLENPRDTGEPGELPSMGSHRVGHDWSDLAAAAMNFVTIMFLFQVFWVFWPRGMWSLRSLIRTEPALPALGGDIVIAGSPGNSPEQLLMRNTRRLVENIYI